MRVLKYLVVLVCAVFSGEWLEAAQALGGLYTSLLDSGEDSIRDVIRLFADVTKGVTLDVTDLVADVVGAAFSVVCMFPALSPDERGACRQRVENVFRGLSKLISGAIDAVRSIADGAVLLTSGVLRGFDVQKITEGAAELALGSTFLAWHSVRTGTGMFVADGYREVSQATELIKCVDSLIKELVPKASREQMRRAVGLDVGMVRITWPVTLTHVYLESDAKDPKVNPSALHPTFINLYDLVGGFNVQWPPPFSRPRNEMV